MEHLNTFDHIRIFSDKINCKKLISDKKNVNNLSFVSFKLTVLSEYFTVLTEPSIWPSGITAVEFKEKKQQQQQPEHKQKQIHSKTVKPRNISNKKNQKNSRRTHYNQRKKTAQNQPILFNHLNQKPLPLNYITIPYHQYQQLNHMQPQVFNHKTQMPMGRYY